MPASRMGLARRGLLHVTFGQRAYSGGLAVDVACLSRAVLTLSGLRCSGRAGGLRFVAFPFVIRPAHGKVPKLEVRCGWAS